MKYSFFGGLIKLPVGRSTKEELLKAVTEVHMNALLDQGIFPSWENYEDFPKHQETIDMYALTDRDIAMLKAFWNDRLNNEMEYARKWCEHL